MKEDHYLYRNIASAFKKMILKGSFGEKGRLPSVRRIATDYKVSVATALHALRQLENEGLVESRPGSGYYTTKLSNQKRNIPSEDTPHGHVTSCDVEQDLSVINSNNGLGLELAGGKIDLYPINKISILIRQMIYKNPGLIGKQIRGGGYPPLKEAIMNRATQYGCCLNDEELLITSGCVESIDLAMRATISPGDYVIVQSPTYFLTLHMLKTLGAKIIEIPMTEKRFDINKFKSVLASHPVKAFLIITHFNNPTGESLSEDDKIEIIKLSEAYNFPIIEDDIYGDIHFSPSRPRPLRAYSDKVILCSSFSKTLSPGIRIGWIAGAAHIHAIAATKYVTSKVTPLYPQAAIAEFMSTGSYDLHLRRLRRNLQSYCEDLRAEILSRFPKGTTISDPKGGFVLWVTLPVGSPNSREIFDLASKENITITPGHLFSQTEEYNYNLRINFGMGSGPDIIKSIRRLAEIIHQNTISS